TPQDFRTSTCTCGSGSISSAKALRVNILGPGKNEPQSHRERRGRKQRGNMASRIKPIIAFLSASYLCVLCDSVVRLLRNDVVTAVYVQDVPGDCAGEVAAQEHGGVGDLLRLDRARQRRLRRCIFNRLLEFTGTDAAGGPRRVR